VQNLTNGRDAAAAAGHETDPALPVGWVLPELDYPTFRIALIAKVMDRLTLRHLSEQREVTFAEWRLMGRLASSPDGATVGQVADLAWVDRAEVSRAATSLEKRGLTSRRENPEDRRKPILFITPEGLQLYEAMSPDRTWFHAQLLADLSETERATLDALLAKIAHRLADFMRNPPPQA